MSTTTPRVGFYMPQDDGSDPVNVATDLNDNLEKLDSAIGFVPAASGTPPVSPYDGLATYETDTGRAKFNKTGSWRYLLTAGASFLSNLLLDTSYRVGIGILSPAAIFDVVVASISSVPLLKFKQASEATHRVEMNSDGIRWGGGAVATDTRIYRSATATLSITGSVVMENNLNVTGATSVGNLNVTGDIDLDGTVASDLAVTGNFSATGRGFTSMFRKVTATSRTNTVTVTNDPEMFVSLEANTVYIVELFLAYRGSTSGDFRSCWSVPTGAAGYRWCLGEAITGTDRENTSMRTGGHNLISEIVYGAHTSGVTNCGWETLYIITTSAGTLNFKWAQGSADSVNATTLVDGTFMRVTKVA
jgi:hypothetical protein